MRRFVITGGPGTGKTSLINALKSRGYECLPEISRQVTLEARKQGIEQLFLEDPLRFSQKLLEGRTSQYREAGTLNTEMVFLDRGLPDVLAYMDYIGDTYPESFAETCKKYRYDKVFLLPPWLDIYATDNERYESFEQAQEIHEALKKTYLKFNYTLVEVPVGKLDHRTEFILDSHI